MSIPRNCSLLITIKIIFNKNHFLDEFDDNEKLEFRVFESDWVILMKKGEYNDFSLENSKIEKRLIITRKLFI